MRWYPNPNNRYDIRRERYMATICSCSTFDAEQRDFLHAQACWKKKRLLIGRIMFASSSFPFVEIPGEPQ
jgi:hypothetical protein